MRVATVLACLLCVLQVAWGQFYDPPPLDVDPTVEGQGGRRPSYRPSRGGSSISGDAPAPGGRTEFAADDLPEEVEPARLPTRQPNVPRDQTRVAVLGYHNFSETKPVTDMLMRTSEFRAQMERIRREGLTVISMQEFLEWRFGARELPAKCVLITIDDGWRSVYTDAYPILKEYGYPFTLFLYTSFLSGRGASMSPAMVREMQQNGATVGSHSANHEYPSAWKAKEAEGPEAYAAMVDKEIGSTYARLNRLFGGSVNTYCFPGGYVTQPMLDHLPSYGFVAAFTVVPGKVTSAEDPWQIHRYMVFGNDPGIFESAMDFRVAQAGSAVSTGSTPGTLPGRTPAPPFPVSPQPQATVRPGEIAISADLSGVAGVDFSSLTMKVSGFGRVPAEVDAASRSVRWLPPYRIYMPNISVHITWKSSDGTSHKAEWSFKVDQAVSVQQ